MSRIPSCVLLVVMALALSGCAGTGKVSQQAPPAPRVLTGTSWEEVDSFSLQFAQSPDGAAPAPREVVFNGSAKKGRFLVTFTAREALVVSSNLDVANSAGWEGLAVEARKGAETLGRVEAGQTVSCCTPGGDHTFATDSDEFRKDNRTWTVKFHALGWGDVRAHVKVEAGFPAAEDSEEELEG